MNNIKFEDKLTYTVKTTKKGGKKKEVDK